MRGGPGQGVVVKVGLLEKNDVVVGGEKGVEEGELCVEGLVDIELR